MITTAIFSLNLPLVDLIADFRLKKAEHLILWELAQDKIISEYMRVFIQRCAYLKRREKHHSDDATK